MPAETPSLTELLERRSKAQGQAPPATDLQKQQFVSKHNDRLHRCVGTVSTVYRQDAEGFIRVAFSTDGCPWIGLFDETFKDQLLEWSEGQQKSLDGTLRWGGFDETPEVLVQKIRIG